jgi:hypothetical protein
MDDLSDRLQRLTIAIMDLFGALPKGPAMRQIGLEAVRTTTSAGESCRDTRHVASQTEFRRRVRGAAKDMAQCLYWLKLIEHFQVVSVQPLVAETDEIIGLLLRHAAKTR